MGKLENGIWCHVSGIGCRYRNKKSPKFFQLRTQDSGLRTKPNLLLLVLLRKLSAADLEHQMELVGNLNKP